MMNSACRFKYDEFSMQVKLMSCFIEVFVYRYGFRVFDIFSVIIQSYIEGGFSFSNILDFTKFAFW